MEIKRRIPAIGLMVAMGVLAVACSANLKRNPDGSLTLETTMTEESLQAEIQAAIADPLIRDFRVELRDGYIVVSGERKRALSDQSDTMSFRLDLGVGDGHLTAVISEVQLNGLPIEEARVAVWNERIATRLEQAGKSNPDSSLQAVTVGDDAITMAWRIETRRSRGD